MENVQDKLRRWKCLKDIQNDIKLSIVQRFIVAMKKSYF